MYWDGQGPLSGTSAPSPRQLLPDPGGVAIVFFDALGVRLGVVWACGKFFNILLTNRLV